MRTRRKVTFATALITTWLVFFGIFIEVQYLNYCTICYQQDSFYTVSLERNDASFILLPKINCKENPPFLVVLITTTHGLKEARMAIRQTWGKARTINDKNVVAFFLLGTSASGDQNDQATLVEEHNTYHDIIQRDFTDVYYNLTLKTIMGLDWLHHFCPQATFAMKTDTDMYINPFNLVYLLLIKNITVNFFTGFLKPNEFPIRNWFSKWYVSRNEYPHEKYPPFCSGTGYVFSVDVAQKIQAISTSVPFIKLEDVYMGLCLERLNIPLQELHERQTFFPEGLSFSVCAYRGIVASHQVQPRDILLYWQALERSETQKC
uniref:Hexosyltransferase n=1 Tax=Leptobrachium leishanense TaxID=445787 RepID=A0A8C5LY18_9ANUR